MTDRQSDTTWARRAFIAAKRHDLRTPINAIIGYSELTLEDWQETGDPRTTDLEKVHTAGRALLASVDQVLDPEEVDAGRLDTESLESLADRIRLELRSDLNVVIGYSEMLLEDEQTRADEDLAADLGRIRSAAEQLVDLINDIVEFEPEAGDDADPGSERDSRSSMIADVVATIRELEEGHAAAEETGHILVVDDNEMNRELIARRLERAGHTYDLAANGEEALERVKDVPYDLILLDILMPVLDGFQVLRRLKTDDEVRHIPVIMLSALDQIEDVARTIEMGADDFLPKPFDPVLLSARIGASLEKKRLRDREQEYLRQLRIEREQSERLLLNILPAPIAARLKESETTIADSFSAVTVLFADIVGFTNLSARIPAQELVGRLNEVFSAFDSLAADHSVEKIKTIGDAYMAVAGLPTAQPDHAERVAEMALDMLAAIADLNGSTNEPLAVRVGVATGPVVAGVIGARKFAYDLWGDTVNTASRMESTGVPGKIQVTEATRDLLEDRYVLERRGTVEVKGKGRMETHFLAARR